MTPKARRWCRNLGLVVLNSAGVQLLMLLQAMEVAVLAGENSWGLPRSAGLPPAASIVLSVALLDLVIYLTSPGGIGSSASTVLRPPQATLECRAGSPGFAILARSDSDVFLSCRS